MQELGLFLFLQAIGWRAFDVVRYFFASAIVTSRPFRSFKLEVFSRKRGSGSPPSLRVPLLG